MVICQANIVANLNSVQVLQHLKKVIFSIATNLNNSKKGKIEKKKTICKQILFNFLFVFWFQQQESQV